MRHPLLPAALSLCLAVGVTPPAVAQGSTSPPAPVGPLPSEAQVQWQRLEYTAFVHFGPNAFTGAVWGTGTEKPGIFNPKDLDARQWVRTFKASGMRRPWD